MTDLQNGPVVITSEIHHEEQQHRSTTNLADQLGASPYSNINVGRAPPARHSLTAEHRPKQKVRKPSRQWLDNKSGEFPFSPLERQGNEFSPEESELSTDDIFWSKHDEDQQQQQQQQMQAMLYPSLPPKIASPPPAPTPSTPVNNAQQASMLKSSPSSIGTLRARAHNFISRNILIPETCCVVRRSRLIFQHFIFLRSVLVFETNSFRQIGLSMSILQCSVSYGLQRKLCDTLFTQCENAESRCRVEIYATRNEPTASARDSSSLCQRN